MVIEININEPLTLLGAFRGGQKRREHSECFQVLVKKESWLVCDLVLKEYLNISL